MAITAVGQTQSFGYTGKMQSFTAPFSGLYLLTCKGSKGSGGSNAGANLGGEGGITTGKILLKKGDIIHICVGGAGKGNRAVAGENAKAAAAGGYNGGGNGGIAKCGDNEQIIEIGSGGGCTHIALVSGVLSSLSGYKDKILIVAGGGGGGAYVQHFNDYGDGAWFYYSMKGGSGGGENGGKGTSYKDSFGTTMGASMGNAGGPSNGANFGLGQSANTSNNNVGAGGGGGWYGGFAGTHYNGPSPGGGGSGYINTAYIIDGSTNVTTWTSSAPYNGSASIKLLEKSVPTMFWGDLPVEALYWGDKEASSLFYGIKEVD